MFLKKHLFYGQCSYCESKAQVWLLKVYLNDRLICINCFYQKKDNDGGLLLTNFDKCKISTKKETFSWDAYYICKGCGDDEDFGIQYMEFGFGEEYIYFKKEKKGNIYCIKCAKKINRSINTDKCILKKRYITIL